MSIEQTLSERGNRYGDFADHAEIAQSLQRVMHKAVRASPVVGQTARPLAWECLNNVQRQALTVIADKIARILSGDPNYADNWHDIQGYAKLVEDRLPPEMPSDFGQQHTIEPEIEPFSVSGKHTIEPASLIDDEQSGIPGANELHDLARVAIDEGLFWVPWGIGNCPFDEDKMVCVLLADTTVQVQKAGKLEWHNASDPRKVVAYSRHTAT